LFKKIWVGPYLKKLGYLSLEIYFKLHRRPVDIIVKITRLTPLLRFVVYVAVQLVYTVDTIFLRRAIAELLVYLAKRQFYFAVS